jgi:cytochrome c-type biogenesis protein
LALGLVSGLVASQCATPALAAILTYVLARGSFVYGATLLLVYALGRGVPIVLAGTFTGALGELRMAGHWSTVIQRGSGVVMLAAGVYFLWIA